MIGLLGQNLLIACLISYSISLISAGNIQRIAFIIASLTIAASMDLLVLAFIRSDFIVTNVFYNSSTELPWIFKISAAWASHEGSILLWSSLLGIVLFFTSINITQTQDSRGIFIRYASLIQLLILGFIIYSSNPFNTFSFAPEEGLGLNPMLQDLALAIHPPILYLGNICYGTIFVLGLVILHRPDNSNQLLSSIKLISNIALTFLTIGIGLGSWWAYRELGWGGYWFFDPVENISILPWIGGIILHHYLLLTMRTGKYLNHTIIFCLINFLLVLYGTFIVRSGIISSVHSFAFSPQRGVFIFAICLILTILAIFVYFKKKTSNTIKSKFNSQRENLIFYGNLLWKVALLIIIVSLIYPIYCYLFYNEDIVVAPEYFHYVFVPIFVPIIFLSGFACEKKSIFVNIILNISLLVFLIFNNNFNLISTAILYVSCFVIINSLHYLFIAFKNNDISKTKLSFFFGHFGMSMLAIAVTLNVNLSEQISFIGKKGQKIEVNNKTITLENLIHSKRDNFYQQIAIFNFTDENNHITILKPENRLYKIENKLSQEVDIYSYLYQDIYAVLSKIDKDIIHAEIYLQPMISLIWFSIFLIAIGFVVNIRTKKTV